jgi:hypothetical protein
VRWPAAPRVSIARVASDSPYLSSFVLPFDEPAQERREHFDLYLPGGQVAGRPAIVFLHGLYPAHWRPSAREWPTYVGYGATAAASGAVGVVADIALHGPADYPRAADVIGGIIDEVRRDVRVDSDRFALRAFSGGGLLTGRWLSESHPWLRCVALSYPVLAPVHGWAVHRGLAAKLYAGGAVDSLPDQVGVAVVAGVLLDHVDVDPAEVDVLLHEATGVG